MLLTTKQVAVLLQVHSTTVVSWIKEEILEAKTLPSIQDPMAKRHYTNYRIESKVLEKLLGRSLTYEDYKIMGIQRVQEEIKEI